jgi:hypothetical protein
MSAIGTTLTAAKASKGLRQVELADPAYRIEVIAIAVRR